MFVTDKAFYYWTDHDSTYDPEYMCGMCCVGDRDDYLFNARIAFDEIVEVERKYRDPCTECCYCCSPPSGYGPLDISNRNMVVRNKNTKRRATVHQKVHVPLVKNPESVTKLLLFLRDATRERRIIDWESIIKEFS